MRRFFIRLDAIEGGRVRFDADETRHLARVLRLRPGALLEAIDGTGRMLTVRLGGLGAGTAWGTVVTEGAPSREPPCAITLAPAVLRGARMTWLLQKATELGVARIAPVETERVVARAELGVGGGRLARWERIVREAVKQCGRAVAPTVEPPRRLGEVLLEEVPRHDTAWLLREGGGSPLAAVARAAGRPRRVLLLVGPEGGLTADEVALAESAGARVVGLGPRILRAESAGVVAVALCQHLFGDLGQEGESDLGVDAPLRS